MEKKLICFIIVSIMCMSSVVLSANDEYSGRNEENISTASSGQIEVLSDDLLRYITPTDPVMTPSMGPGPGYYDTSEYFIGSVGVGLIFLTDIGIFWPVR